MGALVCASACVACRHERAAEAAGLSWRQVAFSPSADAPDGQLAQVMIPPGGGERPLVVALHGRGEAGRGLKVGARGWRDDYALQAMQERLLQGRLTPVDLGKMTTATRLGKLHRSLGENAYRGLYAACPYTPALTDRSQSGAEPFGRFITEQLLPRIRRDLSLTTPRDTTGIDGVSMGGRLALWIGLSNPSTFGSVGALQPAIAAKDLPTLAKLARQAQQVRAQHLRLVTSEGDPFRSAIEAFSRQLAALSVNHELIVTPGPHDYSWNRGPGAAELLLWHERVLRGLPPP